MIYRLLNILSAFLVGVFSTSTVYTHFVGKSTGREMSFAGSGMFLDMYFDHMVLGPFLALISVLLFFGFLYTDYKLKESG